MRFVHVDNDQILKVKNTNILICFCHIITLIALSTSFVPLVCAHLSHPLALPSSFSFSLCTCGHRVITCFDESSWSQFRLLIDYSSPAPTNPRARASSHFLTIVASREFAKGTREFALLIVFEEERETRAGGSKGRAWARVKKESS